VQQQQQGLAQHIFLTGAAPQPPLQPLPASYSPRCSSMPRIQVLGLGWTRAYCCLAWISCRTAMASWPAILCR
jgi:hypothetical protein